ncbi:MAG: hypothetical protein HYY24_10065 [Verrucomicrobia bacterium]|nr:hypothetical protein [Verrucomicrobiota bacterium]
MNTTRHPFGTNLDSGIPLTSEEDFRLLFVECQSDSRRRLTEWLTAGSGPLLLCGQIGSGKTTLLAKCLLDTGQRPNVEIRFDCDVIRQTAGGFWRAVLLAISEAAARSGVDFSFSRLPKELAGLESGDWDGLMAAMAPRVDSVAHAERRRQIEDALEATLEVTVGTVTKLLQSLHAKAGRPPIVLATGLDKYAPQSPAMFLLLDCVRPLLECRSVFELNAVHLFGSGPWEGIERVLLTGLPDAASHELLRRRLGRYAPTRQTLVPKISQLAGGNPRQALRLLSAFEQSKQHVRTSDAEALQTAVRQAARDFFAFAEAPAPELLKSVQRQGLIESGLLALPGDKETARLALYGNWVLLQGVPVNGTAWPARVNPVVEAVMQFPVRAESPEEAALKRFAEQAGMSSTGIGLGSIGSEKAQEVAQWNLRGVLEYGTPSKLSEILDAISAALLSRRRHDRTILVYRNAELVDPLREYLFASANAYEVQRCRHAEVIGGESEQPVEKILQLLSAQDDVLSLHLRGSWTDDQISALDKQRDKLLGREILLWLPEAQARRFLRGWEHLRQLCQLFVVEDELLASLPQSEIRAELELLGRANHEAQTPEAIRIGHLKALLSLLDLSKAGA